MTTVNAPFAWVGANGMITDYGLAKVVLAGLGFERMVNRFNPMTDGIVVPWGDLAGTKSNTLGIPNWTGTGFAAGMAAASSESSDTSLSTATTGQDTISVARQELAFGQTFTGLVLGGGANPLDWPMLAESMVDATIRRIRALADTAGASISSAIGDGTRDNNYDDLVNLSIAFRETSGFSLANGRPKVVLHPEQLSGIDRAIRAEPGLQSPDVHSDRLAARDNAGYAGTVLNMDLYTNDTVTASSGVWQGYAVQTGAIGLAVANPAGLGDLPPAGAIELFQVPALGLSVWIKVDPGTTTIKVYAFALLGVALGAATVRPQYRLIGIND